jgi:predicted O-methyltransferase YrrM
MTAEEYLSQLDDTHQMTTSRCHIAELCELARSATSILELGSHAGFSAAAMALANPAASVVAVDLCDTIPEESRVAHWAAVGAKNITPVHGFAASYIASCGNFDLVFHDAAHGDAVLPEYQRCAEIASVLAIHDFEQLSAGAQSAVSSLFASHTRTTDSRGRDLFVGRK